MEAAKKDSAYKAVAGTMFSSQKGEYTQQNQYLQSVLVSHGQDVPLESQCRAMDFRHLSHAAGGDLTPFPRRRGRYTGGIIHVPCDTHLRNKRKFTVYPEQGKGFLNKEDESRAK